MFTSVIVRNLRKRVNNRCHALKITWRDLHGSEGQTTAKAFGMVHRPETRQYAVLQHGIEAAQQFIYSRAELAGDLTVRLLANRKTALQVVDDGTVQGVHDSGFLNQAGSLWFGSRLLTRVQ